MAAINPTSPPIKSNQLFEKMSSLFSADEKHNFQEFIFLLPKILKEHPFTFQQVETALRLKNCRTYLIARQRNSSHGPNLIFAYPPGTLKTYYLFTTMKPKPIAMQQLLEESNSYAANFKKLNDTGFLTLDEHIPLQQQFLSGTTFLTEETLHQYGLNDPSQPVTHINPLPTTSIQGP